MINKNVLVPYVIEKNSDGERSYDLMSRLLQDRIVFIQGEVDDASMNIAAAELLFLNNQDSEKPIFMYINSPGGSVTAGLALIDTMKFIKAPVYTFCMGVAASMGAAILSCGEKGHRYILPNATVMLHQTSGGFKGNIMDHEVEFEFAKKLNDRLAVIISENCGKTKKEYLKTVQRDNWLFADDALKFGIVDKIIDSENGVN